MSATGFRNDIQGLRAIAVLAVMAFHYNPAWLPGGFVGVDVFLVISGFLITSILINKKSKPDYTLSATLKYFYVSRFKRIAPAYFAMLILVALVAAVFFIPKDFATFEDGLEKAISFTSNHYFADFGDYFAPANHEQPLLHTWSLAVEVQFYLLAPFLVLLLPVKALKTVFVTLLIGLTLLAEYRLRIQGIEQATYYSLYARLPEFFAGGLAAIYSASASSRNYPSLPYLGIALIVFAAFAQASLGPFPGISVLLPVLGSVLLLLVPARGVLGRILRNRGLVWIGALSYSLYLWHWPVLAFLRYYSGAEVLDGGLGFLFILLTTLLSVVSYYWVEKFFRSSRPIKRGALEVGVLATIVLGASPVLSKMNETLSPEALPVEYSRYADPAKICHGRIVDDCLKGDLNSEKEILVLGDSHGAMLNKSFDYLGNQLNFKARIITASNCVTIPEFDYQRIADWAQKACIDQVQVAIPHIRNTKTIFIAGAWSKQIKSKEFNMALKRFLGRNANKNIILLSQIPRFRLDVQRVQRFTALGFPRYSMKDLSYKVANQELRELVRHYKNVEFWTLSELPLFNEAPFHRGIAIYLDEHHLNEVGALLYGKSAAGVFQDHLKASDSD